MPGTHRYIYFFAMMGLFFFFNACGGSGYHWGWYEILPTTPKGWTNLKFLFSGLGLTSALTVISIGCSVFLGLLISLPGISQNRYLRAFNRIYVELFRSIPVLVMILWVYYGMPVVLGISLDPFAAGNRAKLVRQIDGSPVECRIRLKDLLTDGDISQNVALFPGDVIIVPAARF